MIKVLVVDDDFMVARIHRGFVDRVDGFEVVGTANSGEQALTAIRELRPDLVLLDLYLPDIFGIELIGRLRAEQPDCDILVITAAREADAVRGAVRQGVVNYLLKPFGFEDLRSRLQQYVRQRASVPDQVTSQADVDRVLTPSRPPANRLPKGLSQETAVLVATALRGADSLSAAECAEQVGLSRVSARRYLEFFCTREQAAVALRYGATGRPERRYRWRA
ncbi:response regulator [Kribbella sandramycini]|uniref:Transcriptional regulatory protein n=1 Tax=Kribbella sandramycini TaxID=60450 RepID=A0A7Y4P257_9ACTN|nr:response regulator [Kribbella sandramycini]MBB6566543.1 response regulator of citrate/malate metabolism [Kribbella sandramycini]NOL42800.1 response regulator [Kribbella sandramycini]